MNNEDQFESGILIVFLVVMGIAILVGENMFAMVLGYPMMGFIGFVLGQKNR